MPAPRHPHSHAIPTRTPPPAGYHAFFRRALQPDVHYLPFWTQGPEELLEELAWVRANPEQAQRVAQAGAAFAQRFLNAQARACYWLYVLQGLARRAAYSPSLSEYRRAVPLQEFVDMHVLHSRLRWGVTPVQGQPFEP